MGAYSLLLHDDALVRVLAVALVLPSLSPTPQYRTNMKLGCRWKYCFLLALHIVGTWAYSEQFDEDLTLRPLRDGKLSARFQFNTLLRVSHPRDPQKLHVDDEGTPASSHDGLPPATAE